jgi:radical SAM protein with 4Fe4S-binding SPASM domain
MGSKIKNIGWSIGYYCNAKCKHCYSWISRQNRSYLTKEETDVIIERMAEQKVKTLNLGGNEPIFTHGSNISTTMLPYIIKKVTDRGIKIGITTNGITAVYLYKHYKDVLRMVNDWDVSLDSPFREEHNNNRGIKIYDIAIKALRLLVKEHIPTAIVYCLMNWNCDYPHLSALLKLAKREKAEIRINTLRPIVAAHLSLFPSIEQFYQSFIYLLKNTSSVILSEPLIAALCGIKIRGSPCGIYSMRILSKRSDGSVPVSPCVYLNQLAVGNILKEEIAALSNYKPFKVMRKRYEKLPTFCRNCEYKETCRGGCAARAVLVKGSLNEPDPYCFKLLKEKRIINTLQALSEVIIEKTETRVHKNYLCTWAGRPL